MPCDETRCDLLPTGKARLPVRRRPVARLQTNLGRTYEVGGHYEEAVSLLEETLGADHPNTVAVRRTLAMLCERMGRPEESALYR